MILIESCSTKILLPKESCDELQGKCTNSSSCSCSTFKSSKLLLLLLKQNAKNILEWAMEKNYMQTMMNRKQQGYLIIQL